MTSAADDGIDQDQANSGVISAGALEVGHLAEGLRDLLVGLALGRGAYRVADQSAEQAAADPGLERQRSVAVINGHVAVLPYMRCASSALQGARIDALDKLPLSQQIHHDHGN